MKHSDFVFLLIMLLFLESRVERAHHTGRLAGIGR
jgi:hypothetical protein